ncbi:MAG TPA: PEGA domain-containing protein [Polyangiaceae bacterium]|nr:PEGA domain-containing protein [Polyangiaceae bacterium]
MSALDRRWGGALLGLALGAATVTAPSVAAAQAAHETLFFDALARRAYARGDYQEALRCFLLARETASGAGMAYNVAVSADLAGEPELAYSSLVDYLALDDPDLARRRDATERLVRLRRQLAVVRIETEPPGAEVFVDRRDLGRFGRTPREIAVLPGARILELDLPGFEPARVELTAARGAESSVEVALVPRRGSLVVSARPAATAITLEATDGRRAALRPGEVVELPAGAYRVEAAAWRYAAASRRVEIAPGERVEVVIALDRIPVPTGGLLVASGPLTATVYVDGRRRAVTPARVEALPAGEHVVELRAPGYLPWRRTVAIEADQTSYLNAAPRPVPRGQAGRARTGAARGRARDGATAAP